MTMQEMKSAGAIEVDVTIEIDARRDTVWHTLVSQTAEWWHKDFFVTQGPATFVCEPRVGGRFFEDCGDGSGFVWFTIQGIEPPNYIYMIGHTRPPYGGPCTSLIMVTLEERSESRTLLRISDTTHGRVSDDMAAGLRDGWQRLFGALKRLIEQQ